MNAAEITKIDCDGHRRYVASFRDFFCMCTEAAVVPPVNPGDLFEFGKLKKYFDNDAMGRFAERFDDLPPAVLDEPAKHLNVDVTPSMVPKLGEMNVGEVARRTREEFVEMMVKGVLGGAPGEAVSAHAGELRDAASATVAGDSRHRATIVARLNGQRAPELMGISDVRGPRAAADRVAHGSGSIIDPSFTSRIYAHSPDEAMQTASAALASLFETGNSGSARTL